MANPEAPSAASQSATTTHLNSSSKPNYMASPFPAASKQASNTIGGVRTDVTVLKFVDKILITIVQNGKIPHWVHVKLEQPFPGMAPSPAMQRKANQSQDNSTETRPLPGLVAPLEHLTTTTILGGVGSAERDTIGQVIARQIASSILSRLPHEKRLLVIGIGIEDLDAFTHSDSPLPALNTLVMGCIL